MRGQSVCILNSTSSSSSSRTSESRERTAEIDVPGDRVGFLAVDEDLHAARGRQVRG